MTALSSTRLLFLFFLLLMTGGFFILKDLFKRNGRRVGVCAGRRFRISLVFLFMAAPCPQRNNFSHQSSRTNDIMAMIIFSMTIFPSHLWTNEHFFSFFLSVWIYRGDRYFYFFFSKWEIVTTSVQKIPRRDPGLVFHLHRQIWIFGEIYFSFRWPCSK